LDQYKKKFVEWGLKKQRPKGQMAQQTNQLSSAEVPPVAAGMTETSICSWMNEPDFLWSGMRCLDQQQPYLHMRRESDTESASQAQRQQIFTNLFLLPTPRSSTSSGWASFQDTNSRTPAFSNWSLKKKSHAANASATVEYEHKQQRTSQSRKTLSSSGSEDLLDPPSQLNKEDQFQLSWKD
jgi:hypothetical protein